MTRADSITILFATLLLAGLYYIFWQPQVNATHAKITASDQQIKVVDLNRSQELHIKGKLDDSVLKIKDGKIRFTHSPCKGKVCIHRGWLKYSGETMACLPNKVFVELTGGIKKFDSINY
jgi:hypothetical protein